MARKTIFLLALAALYAPSAVAQLNCFVRGSERPIRAGGMAERISDVLVECIDPGGQVATATQATLQITLNVNITNPPVAQGSNVVTAIAIVNENNCGAPTQAGVPVYGSCGAPDPTVQDPQYATRVSNGRVQWTLDIPPPNTSPNNISVIRLTMTLANADQLGPLGGPVTAFLSSAVTLQNNVLVVGRATTGPSSALGVYFEGSWYLDRNGDDNFDPNIEVSNWGSVGDIPMQGDWNGDGVADLGVFAGGTWYLDLNGNGQFEPATEVRPWGEPGWLPITGDWNGDGITNLGVIDTATMTWFRDMNGDYVFDPVNEIDGWGSPGDIPVVGDWDGDGDDDLGVFSGGIWFIDSNGNRAFDLGSDIYGWGVAGWIPVVGDWDGDGDDDLGVVEPATFTWFRDINGDKAFNPSTEVLPWGSPGDQPVVADWTGNGKDQVGVYSGGYWLIDMDSSQTFDPVFEAKPWGVAGWAVVPGAWR